MCCEHLSGRSIRLLLWDSKSMRHISHGKFFWGEPRIYYEKSRKEAFILISKHSHRQEALGSRHTWRYRSAALQQEKRHTGSHPCSHTTLYSDSTRAHPYPKLCNSTRVPAMLSSQLVVLVPALLKNKLGLRLVPFINFVLIKHVPHVLQR